ncbi:hypothetical protein D9611_000601 [Ephemerocybe angulata]|uniref:Ribonucleoside-diphosphate reductase n=1 Tax=Ephemerocybe angulata TaxID=980116 RepID=A0A8H5BM86_9AGAR|nr:hypothetical protein D9611_000601 [Tulosesus angulatus]
MGSHPYRITSLVCSKIGLTVQSKDLDSMLADAAATINSADPVYPLVARTLLIDKIHKEAGGSFSASMEAAYNLSFVSRSFYSIVEAHKAELDIMIEDRYDEMFTYSSLGVFLRRYIIRSDRGAVERPQHTFLRAALQMHPDDLASVRIAYEHMAQHKYLPASPILIYSGTDYPALSSSYILPAGGSPLKLFDTLKHIGEATMNGGGLGIGLGAIPAKGTLDGVVPRAGLVSTLKLLDAAMPILNEGQNVRPAAMTNFVEIWHADILSFVEMKRTGGPERARARELSYCLWINDLFMQRVAENEPWTLFCPTKAPGLLSKHGEDFAEEYRRLELEGLGSRTVRARDVWRLILLMILTTGGPAIMYKDAVNAKSNQSHLGVISQSGTCMENTQFCDAHEIAVCLYASLILPSFVSPDRRFRYDLLEGVTRQTVRSLTRSWGEAHLPLHSARASARSHRPLGIGMQGLADTLAMMSAPFDSALARGISEKISETIHFAAIDESCDLVSVYGPHPSFRGSPASKGQFQHDLWTDAPSLERYPWDETRTKMKNGMANALLTVVMPTAGTSQISGYTEGVEPFPSLARTRTVRGFGQTTAFPQHLVDSLDDYGLWTDEIRDRIIANNGSVQAIQEIPIFLRDMYRTCWEIEPYAPIRMATDRGRFVCQSQSLTLYVSPPSINSLSRQLIHAWWAGLKTGMYYIQTSPSIIGQGAGSLDGEGDEDLTNFLLAEVLASEACQVDPEESGAGDEIEDTSITPASPLDGFITPAPFSDLS